MQMGSGIEDLAGRLLGAFFDLSGGKLNQAVTLDEASARAGLEEGSTEPAVAVRYLLNKGYLEEETPQGAQQAQAGRRRFTVTVPGMDRVREERGLAEPAKRKGLSMSDGMQRLLLTALTIGLSSVIKKPFTGFIARQIPDRRGTRDDFMEALVQGLARLAAVLLASVIVRKLAGR